MALSPKMIQKIVGTRAQGPLTAEDAERILEIACLTVATDGKLANEEIEAVRLMGVALRARAEGAPFSQGELDRVLDAVAQLETRDDRDARLRAVAGGLTTDTARHVAYKASVTAAMSDLNASDEEFELDIDLIDALGLPTAKADDLTAEVHEALIPE